MGFVGGGGGATGPQGPPGVSSQTPWASDIVAAGHQLLGAGNIGIGVASPQNPLDIGAGVYPTFGGSQMTISNTAGNAAINMGQSSSIRGRVLWMYNSGGPANGYLLVDCVTNTGAQAANPVVLQPGGGRVGIGNNVPGYVLDVAGDCNISGQYRVNGTPIAAGSMVLLEEHTASGSASLAFTNCFSSLYDSYEFQFIQVLPVSNAVNLLYQLSSDGGATYSSAAVYNTSLINSNPGSGTVTVTNVVTGTSGLVAANESNAGAWGIYGSMRAGGVVTSSVFRCQISVSTWDAGGGNTVVAQNGTTYYAALFATNAIKFSFTTGNIASGTIRCYGFAK